VAAGVAEPVVECAAAVLEEQSETIVARWLKRLPEETPSLPRDLSLEEAENAAPQVLHGIADALRLGQPWELEAPWAAAARRHAEQRLRQGEALRDLLREFQLLREEVWAALAEQLRPASASEIFALARSLDATLDGMAANSARFCGEEQRRIAERAERLRTEAEYERRRWQATVNNMLDSVTTSDAEGHATYMNEAYFRLLGLPIKAGLPVSEHPRYYRLCHPDGTLFRAEDLPLQRAALRNEQARGVKLAGITGQAQLCEKWWSRSPTVARASRPASCQGSSSATGWRVPAASAARGSGWGCTLPDNWSRPTAAASGPRASWGLAAPSPSASLLPRPEPVGPWSRMVTILSLLRRFYLTATCQRSKLWILE